MYIGSRGIYVAKTKAMISFAVTTKLICVFVFAYAKSRFSHDVAQSVPENLGMLRCLICREDKLCSMYVVNKLILCECLIFCNTTNEMSKNKHNKYIISVIIHVRIFMLNSKEKQVLNIEVRKSKSVCFLSFETDRLKKIVQSV